MAAYYVRKLGTCWGNLPIGYATLDYAVKAAMTPEPNDAYEYARIYDSDMNFLGIFTKTGRYMWDKPNYLIGYWPWHNKFNIIMFKWYLINSYTKHNKYRR